MSSSQYSAQGSITIKRLRNGDSLFISLDLNGVPLYQGIDPTTGNPSPNWKTAETKPVITPKVTSVRGNNVARSSSQWSYNGVLLLFTGETTTDGVWRKDSTGKFQICLNNGTADEGALRIIDNLAEADAVANGQLTYSCVATVSGTNYNLSKSIDVIIQSIGASSYYGYVTAGTTILEEGTDSTKLTAKLLLDTQDVTTGVYVKWYKDSELWTPEGEGEGKGGATATVTRSDVDGTQLFIAEFYILATNQNAPSLSDTPVARAGIYIVDSLDDFNINLAITSTNKEVTATDKVVVQATIINTRTNTTFTPTNGATWVMSVMDKDTWEAIRVRGTGNTEGDGIPGNVIYVTTAETDRNDKLNDVEVVAEATWT
jgi:hypothetical protein